MESSNDFPPPGRRAAEEPVWQVEATAETVPNSAMEPVATRLTISDIYYVLFKHKVKIILCSVCGVVAALAFYELRPPPFVSQAKLLVQYVETTSTLGPDADQTQMITPGRSGDSVMQTEVEILSSLDLARQVAGIVGPETILGPATGPVDADTARDAAARAVTNGLEVVNGKNSNIIDVSYRNAKPEVVQQVLRQVIIAYFKRHGEIHRSVAYDYEFLSKETDRLRLQLNDAQTEARRLKESLGIVDLAQAKVACSERLVDLDRQIGLARTELARKEAILQALTGSSSEPPPETAGAVEVPPDAVRDYAGVAQTLTMLYQRERDYLQTYTAESPFVLGVRRQIAEQERARSDLEARYPALTHQPVAAANPGARPTAPAYDAATELVEIKAAKSTIENLNAQRTEVTSQLAALNTAEPKIVEAEWKVALLETQHQYFASNLERARADDTLKGGRTPNISYVQEPSPPVHDAGKRMKVMLGLAAGGVGLGFGLAFFIELYLDQTLRRSVDVENKLGLPLFISIPRLGRRVMRKLSSSKPAALLTAGTPAPEGSRSKEIVPVATKGQVPPWSPEHALRRYFEALRNRLVYNFEVRNLTHNPKLVAITSCGTESGVSTVAAGLASTLSEIGEGNVLLVNMHPDQRVPFYFRKGDLQCDIDQALEPEERSQGMVKDNLYVVSNASGKQFSHMLPMRFNTLVPKFRASDYDYIIFDLPPVSQISITPQLVRYMDMVLLTVEAEKTHRDSARRAARILSSSGAQVGVVLNKTKSYVPAALDAEAVGT